MDEAACALKVREGSSVPCCLLTFESEPIESVCIGSGVLGSGLVSPEKTLADLEEMERKAAEVTRGTNRSGGNRSVEQELLCEDWPPGSRPGKLSWRGTCSHSGHKPP